MTWEAAILIVAFLTSIPLSVIAAGKVRTKTDMACNVATLLLSTWLVLRLDGVL